MTTILRVWMLANTLCLLGVVSADDDALCKPLMCVTDEVVVEDNFEKPHSLDRDTWLKRQGTRWAIEDGVLRGRESSAEYQAARKHHVGYEPRLSVPSTPDEFIASFSIRFLEGSETAIVPFIEFGHHVCRVRFSQQGTTLLADGETMMLAQARTFVWEKGKWYDVLAEMKDGQFVIQFAGGPTILGERESFRRSPKSGGNGLGIAGPKHGVVELDNVKIWSVKAKSQSNWNKRKSEFPVFAPVKIKEPKKK